MIMNSVFRLAVRRTDPRGLRLEPEAAGERKMCWTKPLSRAGLWVLKSIGSPEGAGGGKRAALNGPGGRACCGLAG
jgi:hypothetical protein